MFQINYSDLRVSKLDQAKDKGYGSFFTSISVKDRRVVERNDTRLRKRHISLVATRPVINIRNWNLPASEFCFRPDNTRIQSRGKRYMTHVKLSNLTVLNQCFRVYGIEEVFSYFHAAPILIPRLLRRFNYHSYLFFFVRIIRSNYYYYYYYYYHHHHHHSRFVITGFHYCCRRY